MDPEGLAPLWAVLPEIAAFAITYSVTTKFLNARVKIDMIQLCNEIREQYQYLINNVDSMCMDDLEKFDLKNQFEQKKNIAFQNCMRGVGK